MPADKTLYSWNINDMYLPASTLLLENLFDPHYADSNLSAIDKFLKKSKELNLLLLDPNNIKSQIDSLKVSKKLSTYAFTKLSQFLTNTNNVPSALTNLILLGHVSLVESYFREIFRDIILVDELSQKACREKQVSYGAAITHELATMPDALLEFTTFLSLSNIDKALREYLGFSGNFPNSLNTALKNYSQICQLRHCIIHRFGKLGVNNAIKLDWDKHNKHVEKPIVTDWNSLQEISQVCYNLIKETNNFLWQFIMMRQIADGTYNNFTKKNNISWTWIWKTDKSRFKKYYERFISTLLPPTSTDMQGAYLHFKTKYNNL